MATRLGLSVLLAGLLAAHAHAQTAEELVGTWKRVPTATSPTARYFRFAATGGGLEGKLLNPPDGLACTVALTVEGGKVTGKGTWIEGQYRADAAWDFKVDGGALVGRSETLDWEEGKIYSREWESQRLERVQRLGLVTTGTAEEPFGEPVPLATLAGGWLALGRAWEGKVDGGKLVLTAVGEPAARIELTDDRGTLRGKATSAGLETKVELAPNEGKLAGRTEWIEGKELGENATSGWAPLELTRLPRIDGGGQPYPLDRVMVVGEQPPLVGVFKRDDGLYLRVHDEGGQLTGDLCTKDGTTKARVRFEDKGGLKVGTVNWDGVEARWELAYFVGLGDPGSPPDGFSGRCEWVDVHEGQVVARGYSGHSFRALRRVH